MATRPSWWTVIVRKCFPGVCLRLAFGVSASVLHPTWLRITPSMGCSCLLSVAWNELGSGRSSLEREVLRDVRVHSSSCVPCVMSFTVSLTRSAIDAIAVSGPRALCRQTALFLGSNVQHGCLRRLVV